ncbi:hypothetical protein [Granulicella mallensis]|uniref:Uncharacterized protein n=1 Tax=Granulicella mallensis (strain ATCC BAA-1857 / DSM 23137 / MP5ACTX8) TaxID=682795 RepID=G8NZW4_GRAMM|nr:hypothetical protein [Granulicella mallensis]AEU34591.1 hypothetical protein AciX8_0233 [Granulicella mallensis MP5ACTX8]
MLFLLLASVYTFRMGALPKIDPMLTGLAEIDEIDGHQIVRLPDNLHVEGKLFHVTMSGNSLHLQPARRKFTDDEWKSWIADMQRYQEELGDIMPGGRNQNITEPEEIFKEPEA